MKKKNFFSVFIVLLLLVISVGYAVLNTTLNITGKSNINKNTWDVHFENVKITDGSVEATKVPVIENSTTVDFETQLNLPGDYYEFTIDVVNDGTIDAMIESIEKTPELSENQKKYLNYIIEYQNGEQITTKQLVKSEEFVRLKVRVELKKDIVTEDLPEVGDVLNLGFTLNYVQSDDTAVNVKDNGKLNFVSVSGNINHYGTVVTIGTEQFYVIGSQGNNVKLLSMYNLYVGGEFYLNSNSWTAYGDEATGKQHVDMGGELPLYDLYSGVTVFSSSTEKGSSYTDYNGSIVERYVNDYKNILESEFSVELEEVRLATRDELLDLGCSAMNCDDSEYFWIYSTSYWLDEPINSSYLYAMRNYNSGTFFLATYDDNQHFGVRPVIVISKDYFK